MQSSGSYRLTVRQGPVPGKILELVKDTLTIGRDVNNDLVINDAEVSRNHSRLTAQSGGYLIEDLASTNGTFVNGQRLISPKLLNAGDVVGLGETIVLEFSYLADAGATVVASAPPPMRPMAEPPTTPPMMPTPEPMPEPMAPPPMPEPMPSPTMAEPMYSSTGSMASSEPAPMPPPAPPPPVPAAKKSNTPMIIGGVCGCLTLCVCLALVAYFAWPTIAAMMAGT
jgi:hypothetical protein